MELTSKRRRPKFLWLGIALVLGTLTVFVWARGASLKAAYFMGVRNMMIVSGATKVEAFRVRQPVQRALPANVPVYGESASGIKLDSQTSARLTRAVLSIHNQRPYFIGGWPDCSPMPGVAFRIWSGNQFVDILPCFACGLLLVKEGPMQQFDEHRSGLLQVAKEVFPNFRKLEKM